MAVSFVVRTYNSMATLPACLASIRRQSVVQEIIVVDSGSSDGTTQYARERGAVLVEVPQESFSYGGSLNRGMEAASHPVCALLSSHCRLESSDYAAAALELHADVRVCATNGSLFDPDGNPLTSTYFERRWTGGLGYSHHSATVARAVWAQDPFNEELLACEDKEWARRVLQGDRMIAFDPRLHVNNSHRRGQGPRALHARGLREGGADALLNPELAASPFKTSIRAWLRDLPRPRRFPYPAYLVHPLRVVELHGRYIGYRSARKTLGEG